jgi:hypothetical protein
MMQPWMGQRLTEEHRRDLTAIGPSAGRTPAPEPAPRVGHLPLTVVASAAPVNPGVASWRRPFGHHLGTLLIRAGTRLGGATMTTS